MAWNLQTTAAGGSYLLASVVSGWDLLPFGSASDAEVLERVASYARGWQPSSVQIERGLFGLGGTFRVFGVALADVSTDAVAAQTEQALNSFWTVGAVRVVVQVSTTPTTPPPSNDWSGTVQMVALAALVLGVVWGISELRKAIK